MDKKKSEFSKLELKELARLFAASMIKNSGTNAFSNAGLSLSFSDLLVIENELEKIAGRILPKGQEYVHDFSIFTLSKKYKRKIKDK